MTTRHIAIVGTGGIGQRHAQSCATLPAAGYRLHLVEPDDENRARAQELLGGGDTANWYKGVSDLPGTIDVAIVATRADIRAAVTRELLGNTSARSLILEKVLFQKLADYSATSSLVSQAGASAWVNCPRRLWPGYRELREGLEGQRVLRLEMSGASWDIGCNAIHFLDLFAFLAGAAAGVVEDIALGEVRPAKRPGMLKIEGRVSGHLMQSGNAGPFTIASTPAHHGPPAIRIETNRGNIEVTEGASAMTVKIADGANRIHPIPFQSQLTAPTVEGIFASGNCDLPSYEESRALHETFVTALLTALARAGQLEDNAVCPIT